MHQITQHSFLAAAVGQHCITGSRINYSASLKNPFRTLVLPYAIIYKLHMTTVRSYHLRTVRIFTHQVQRLLGWRAVCYISLSDKVKAPRWEISRRDLHTV